jgi:hypothetical protein
VHGALMANAQPSSHSFFRGASALEATLKGLVDSARELENATDAAGREAASALRAAHAQLLAAKRALQAAATQRSPLQLVVRP